MKKYILVIVLGLVMIMVSAETTWAQSLSADLSRKLMAALGGLQFFLTEQAVSVKPPAISPLQLSAFRFQLKAISEQIQTFVDQPAPPVAVCRENANTPPVFNWVATLGDVDYDANNGVAVDAQGNVYVTGQFNGEVDFDPSEDGVDIHTAAGGPWDFFVTKYNADNSYGWTRTIGGSGVEAGRVITLDQAGNLYVAGEFGNEIWSPGYSLDFDPTEGVDIHTTSGFIDQFVTKYNVDGSYAGTETIGGNANGGYVMPQDISVDPAGNLLITGYFLYSVDFDPTPGEDWHTAPCSGFCMGNVFITKRLIGSGKYGWTRSFGAVDYDAGRGIASDAEGDIVVTGYYVDTVNVPGWGQIPSYGGEDIFVTKLDSGGNYLRFWTLGSPLSDGGGGVAVDKIGNLFVAGYFSGSVDFDPTAGTDIRSSNGGLDMFISKFTQNGQYVWTRTVGGTGDDCTGDDLSKGGIALDSSGNPVVTGLFENTVDFNPNIGVDLHTSTGGKDIFITKLTTNADYLWTVTFGGKGWEEVQDISVDRCGNPISVGWFMDPVDFDPGEGIVMRRSHGWTDGFTLKLKHVDNRPIALP